MRRFAVKFLILIALVWSGWWYLATSSAQNAVTAWLEQRRAEGWQTDVETMSREGFPLRISTVIDGLSLVNATQNGILVPQITLASPIYWPGHASIYVPDEPIALTTTHGALTLGHDGLRAAIRLHPGTTLQLETMSAASGNMTLDAGQKRLLAAETAQVNVVQGRTPETYKIELSLTGMTLGTTFLDSAALPAGLEPVVADMTVTFDRPWDCSALQETRPQPREIRITEVAAGYGGTALNLSGDLTVDPQGIPTGTLRMRMSNWQGVFEMAQARAVIPPEWAPVIEQVLRSMSQSDGTLDMSITLAQGQMRIGFLPIGPAPRLLIP